MALKEEAFSNRSFLESLTELKWGCLRDRIHRHREIWNPVKQRKEILIQAQGGNREWVLHYVRPGRVWEESFIGPAAFVPAILGVALDRSWASNGQPAPVAGNFPVLNEIGGGLDLTCLGVGANDWVALHTGGNYPLTVAKSPHFHMRGEIPDNTGIFVLIGLVGAVGLNVTSPAAAGAWTLPDDGIWVQYDTNVDNNLRFITSSGGVQTVTVVMAAAPAGHAGVNFAVSDDGTQVYVMLNGTILATHTTNLPTVQLKPYMMAMSRAGGAVIKNVHLHDFRLIFDRGFS